MIRMVVVVVACLFVAGCERGPHQATERDEFNTYFYYPASSQSQEVFLGKVTGISSCQRAASSFANSKNLTPSSG
jgi:hypothetical protein